MERILLSFLRLICHSLSKYSPLIQSNLNLLDSAAKIPKLSKFIVQLYWNRCSDIADCLTFLRRFPKIRDPHMFSRSGIKVTEGFSVISNVPVTTRIAINYSTEDFFFK